jgi:beta-galactosidase
LATLRSVETRDKKLLVNGVPIMIAGVNRHEHCPEKGKAITEASMVQDILLMKRSNFNAVCFWASDTKPRLHLSLYLSLSL